MAWEITGNSNTDPNANFIGTIDNKPLLLKVNSAVNSAEAMHISTNGNVGIGTGHPSKILSVNGTIETAYEGIYFGGMFGVGGNDYYYGVGARQSNSLVYDTFQYHRWRVGTIERMTLDGTSGNLGIGTTTPNPSYALHVHQTGSHAAGILAESDTGTGLAAVTQSPDFVALSAENRQGSAINAFGAETGQFSTGISARGLTAVSGESQNGTGIYGISHSQQSPNVSGVGVFGQCSGKPGAGVIGISEFGTGVIAFGGLQAAGGDGLHAGTTFGWCGTFVSTDGRSLGGVYVSVPAGQPGLQVASGTKSAIVPTSQGSRSLYSEEAAEVWFTDYGFGQLEGGHAVVTIDALFAEAVNLSEPYHVFIQLNDTGAEGAAIANKTELGFEVVELRNGRSNAGFSYRLVAKRRGHEQDRLQHAPWADDDPNLYPEKRGAWEAQQRLLRPDVPNIEVPPPSEVPR